MISIKKDIKLYQYTTFGVGGPAKFFVIAHNLEELMEAVEYAKKQNLKFFVLGGGSNVVISDKGFDGLVIKLENQGITINEKSMEVNSGVVLGDAVDAAAENSLKGFEWAAGIPGNFGGGVRGNAGAFFGSMEDIVESVNFLMVSGDKYEVKRISNKECEFTYRSSIFKKKPNYLVISAKLKLEKGNKDEIQKTMKGIVEKRIQKQPQNVGSAGSFFQNPVVENKELLSEFEKDIGAPSHGGKVAAGWLIDYMGLRGKKIGGAMVSEKHSNFIINTGNAKAEDIIILASLIKQKVRTKLGIQLKEEVQYVGF